MGTYTPQRLTLTVGLDETGLDLSMFRLDKESLDNYRKRLLLEVRDPSGPTEEQLIKSVNRYIGQFEVPVFEIDVIRNSDGDPVATDPYIEVTSTHLRIYSDYESGVLEVELNLVDRDDGYFLGSIPTALAGSPNFSIIILDTDYEYKRSSFLRYGNNQDFILTELLKESRSNKLQKELIQAIYPHVTQLFKTEVVDKDSIATEGDFYVDYVNGVVYTYDFGRGFISYSYRQFPYRFHWQLVRVWPYNDEDKKYLYYNELISDTTGLSENTLLNSEGARIANLVLAVHPLGWGK
jgi:hypothetical protein